VYRERVFFFWSKRLLDRVTFGRNQRAEALTDFLQTRGEGPHQVLQDLINGVPGAMEREIDGHFPWLGVFESQPSFQRHSGNGRVSPQSLDQGSSVHSAKQNAAVAIVVD
jgi:hypothetical protein